MRNMKIFKMVVALLVFALVLPLALPQTVITAEAASIGLNMTKASLYTTEKVQLAVKGTKKAVVWSSSKSSIATVNSTGEVAAVSPGTAVISARVGGKTLKCSVTVKAPELSRKEILMNTGNEYALEMKGTLAPVTWTTSDPAIATVKDGVVKSLGKGGCTITGVYEGSVTEYTCQIIVNDWLSCDAAAIDLKVGEKKKILVNYGMTYLDVSFYFNAYMKFEGGEAANAAADAPATAELKVVWDKNWTNMKTEDNPDKDWQYGLTVTALKPGDNELIIKVEAEEPYNGECEYVVIPVHITE